MFKQEGSFWLYYVGIIIMFLVLFYIAEYMINAGRPTAITTGSGSATTTTSATPRVTLNSTQSQGGNMVTYSSSSLYTAEFATSLGVFNVTLFAKNAPNTVANFIDLANSGFFNNSKLYKVIPYSYAQGGSPNNQPNGGPGYTIPDENDWDSLDYNEDLRVELRQQGYQSTKRLASVDISKYVLAMADPYPNSSGSQFYIILSDQINPVVKALKGKAMVFGRVSDNYSILDEIATSEVNMSGGYPKPIQDIVIKSIKIYVK
jgi:peptidyl-prolyl cis-trans isomerase B (cyclophilin B)